MQYCNVICSQIKKENKMVESNLRFIKHFLNGRISPTMLKRKSKVNHASSAN